MRILRPVFFILISINSILNIYSQDSIYFTPNPFLTSTKIGIYLNHDSKISLRVYTNTGILKSEIIKDSAFSIGTYLFNYGDSLAPGLYNVFLDIAPSKKLTAQLYKTIATSDLKNIKSINQLLVFPNPCNNLLNLAVPLELSKKTCNIKIIDIQGRLINSYLLDSANTNFQIPIEELANGNYLILLESETTNYQSILSIHH